MAQRVAAFALGWLILGAAEARPQAAPQCADSARTMVAVVEGARVPLSATKAERLPYGRPISIFAKPGFAATAVSLHYAFTGGIAGARAGDMSAVETPARSGCWGAAIPGIHLNENATLTATSFAPARLRTGFTPKQLAANWVERLGALPPLEADAFVEQVTAGAVEAVRQAFVDSPSIIVVRRPGQAPLPLTQAMVAQVNASLAIANAFNDVRNAARMLTSNLGRIVAVDPTAAKVTDPTCGVGPTIAQLQERAAALVNASSADLARLVVNDSILWPTCAPALVQMIKPDKDTSILALRARAVANALRLTDIPAITALVSLARQAEAFSTFTALVSTLEVPFGADILERYTQMDVVTAYLPDGRWQLVQPFAAVTWYFFTPGPNAEYTARVQPKDLGERFGLQVGYPFGGVIRASRTSFDPELLVGVIGRVNSALTFSGGVVPGRSTDGRHYPFFFSTNLDVSNLGPLQQIFARRDK